MNNPYTTNVSLGDAMAKCGLIAILRGIHPEEASGFGECLYEQGFRIIEVPLNSPCPFESIEKLRKTLPVDCRVGAGTVYLPSQVEDVRGAGGELIVMPHNDQAVIEAGTKVGLAVIPGVATASEAFAALAHGCQFLKLFPADHLGSGMVKSLRSVLPREACFIPVGGLTPGSLADFVAAGAIGFGLGSALYTPGMTTKHLTLRGAEFVSAWRNTQARV